MIRKSGHFDYDEKLEDFYDYRRYGEEHIQQEGGQFNECGYVAYHSTMPLEDLMMEAPPQRSIRGNRARRWEGSHGDPRE